MKVAIPFIHYLYPQKWRDRFDFLKRAMLDSECFGLTSKTFPTKKFIKLDKFQNNEYY